VLPGIVQRLLCNAVKGQGQLRGYSGKWVSGQVDGHRQVILPSDAWSQRLQGSIEPKVVEVVCADASAYRAQPAAYDVACCIGASMIWGGFRPTLQALKQAVKAGGQIVVGEPYYAQKPVPQELIEFEGDYHTEVELLHVMNEEGLDLKQIFRASSDDRDWYTAFWSQRGQEMYLKYMRPLEGWAVYLMHPSTGA